MRETSFGQLEVLLEENNKPSIEYLIFEKAGRNHKHRDYETFVVLEGKGKVYSGDLIFDVTPGSMVTIPPKTLHWMEPEPDSILKGFLWYHSDDAHHYKG